LTEPLVSIEDLHVHFHTDAGVVKAVDGVSWSIAPGETLGIVGESGSGKSVSALALMGLVQQPPAKITGRILFRGRDLLTASEDELRSLRGRDISMIFQDPLTALNPVYKVGHQVAEVIQAHEKIGRIPARKRAVDLLAEVGIPNARIRADEYPHQFSGGMRQRAMIAMALALDPALLLADEPTTALDVTVQAQILELMKELQREFNSAIILITHDLGVVAETCDDVVVMYGGQCVEQGTVQDIFYRADMPYTWGLLSSMPRMDRQRQERLRPISGQPPSLIRVPKGCVFNPRCNFQDRVEGDRCVTEHPELLPRPDGHAARCHIDPQVRERIWSEEIAPAL
jgi:peptide/nickel transport system ATP-binding protein